MRPQGKVALVTGAGGGFGEGIARLFAAEGARVVCADLRGDAAERIVGEVGGIAVSGDVSRGEDVRRMVDAAANACLWLAEDSSEFITGVLLPVDGGRCA